MSELVFNGNERLYRELGMEEWLPPRSFDENPNLHLDKAPSLRSMEGFTEYFNRLDHDKSPAAGYGVLARDLAASLYRMAGSVDENGWSLVPARHEVILRPRLAINPRLLEPDFFNGLGLEAQRQLLAGEDDHTKVYDFAETAGSQAFRGALDVLLDLNHPQVQTSESGQRYLYEASYQISGGEGKDIYMFVLETFGRDQFGGFRQLEVRNRLPEGFRPYGEPEDPPAFITTGEQEEMEALDRAARLQLWEAALDDLLDGDLKGLSESQRNEVLSRIGGSVDSPDVLKTMVHHLTHHSR